MTLIVDSPPAITGIAAIPSTMPVCAGTQVAFTVTATGTAPLTYTWKKNGTAIANASNNATYTINAVAASDSGQYSCMVSNGCSPAATSTNVQLSVKLPPTISALAANTTIAKSVGDTVTLAVTASGTGTLTYQWYKGGSTIGTNSSSFPIKPIAFTDSGTYTCVVSNGCGSVTSKIITLSVNSRPTITTQPQSQTLYLSQPDTFFVVATGVPTPAYIWKKNGVVINGQTGASLIIASPGVKDSGKYTVTVSNSAGSVLSDTVKFYAKFKSVAAGGNHSLFLKTDGTAWACGQNTYGQLGDGTTVSRSSPIKIMDSVQSIAAGVNHSLLLKINKTLFACGWNNYGQLGDGTGIEQHTPVQITTIPNVRNFTAGGDVSLILSIDGTLYACGDNSSGQLGDNTTINRSSPEEIISNVECMTTSRTHSLILMADGTVFSCGANQDGELGNGSTNNDSALKLIPSITNVKGIAAGSYHTLMLKTDGTMWACGENNFYQIGDGSSDSIPKIIPTTITDIQSITVGDYHNLVLKTDGTLFGFGCNTNGQLGDRTQDNKKTPVQILTRVQSMAAGSGHTLIITLDGKLFACGWNANGQLGDGTMNDRNYPVEIKF
jgi:alpha-tubulin suppressor-like RCC1 family protein